MTYKDLELVSMVGGHEGELDACPMFPWGGVGAVPIQPPLQPAPSASPIIRGVEAARTGNTEWRQNIFGTMYGELLLFLLR
jgi:hypothetical protein